MNVFLPAKRAMLTLYLLMALLGLSMNAILYRYVTMVPDYVLTIISQAVWGLILIVSVFVIPHYFLRAKLVITDEEIAAAGGYLTYRTDYMLMESVKSVSVIVTPFGTLTGLNFVVINALGARTFMSFYKKKDAEAIADIINKRIREMAKDTNSEEKK